MERKGDFMTCTVQWVLFDFGGVLAEEGFVNGLRALGDEQGIDPESVVRAGVDQVFATGFVLGKASEETFWQAMRDQVGLTGTDDHFRDTILNRFVLRPWMLELVRKISSWNIGCAILSDQVSWLDTLDQRHNFSPLFDQVFNSYALGRSKKDPELFNLVASWLGITPEQALFIDDSEGNVERARNQGLQTILYTGREDFMARIKTFCPGLR
jgi:putative hydrolase of the HAD superfamily